jgi:signal peptidase I
MTETQATGTASPWATIWLSPRQTIAQIVATRPTYLALPLVVFGTIAALYALLFGYGFGGLVDEWRLWLVLVPAGAVIGIVSLYLNGLILCWVGMLVGGEAPMRHVRAVIAWSMVPTIAGFIVVVAVSLGLKIWGGEGAAAGSGLSWLAWIFTFWSVVLFMLMLARVEQFGFVRTVFAYLVYMTLTLMLALPLALFVRVLVYQPFNVPSRAMEPTLLEGDYFFASKSAYGYSRFSLPVAPDVSGRFLSAEPRRGDVVVFRLPKDEKTDFVKRVVGMPGERIQMKDGVLYINDAPVKREPLPDFVGRDPCGSAPTATVKRWRETLPNGASYETLDCVSNGFYDNTRVFTVPAGHYFMLGDNRDNSTDSRVLSSVGYIPLENLVGRADWFFFSRAPDTHKVRSERIGTAVR